MKYLRSCVLLAVVGVALAACGDPDPAGPGASAAQSGPGTAAAAAPPAGGVDAGALCDFLRGEVPRLEQVGSEVGRLAQLTGHLYTWTEEQGIDAEFDMDQLTRKACPDVRTDMLELIGADSFANAF